MNSGLFSIPDFSPNDEEGIRRIIEVIMTQTASVITQSNLLASGSRRIYCAYKITQAFICRVAQDPTRQSMPKYRVPDEGIKLLILSSQLPGIIAMLDVLHRQLTDVALRRKWFETHKMDAHFSMTGAWSLIMSVAKADGATKKDVNPHLKFLSYLASESVASREAALSVVDLTGIPEESTVARTTPKDGPAHGNNGAGYPYHRSGTKITSGSESHTGSNTPGSTFGNGSGATETSKSASRPGVTFLSRCAASKSYQIMLARHSLYCKESNCQLEFCNKMKHIRNCKGVGCTLGLCFSTKCAIAHYNVCQKVSCGICRSVRTSENVRRNNREDTNPAAPQRTTVSDGGASFGAPEGTERKFHAMHYPSASSGTANGEWILPTGGSDGDADHAQTSDLASRPVKKRRVSKID